MKRRRLVFEELPDLHDDFKKQVAIRKDDYVEIGDCVFCACVRQLYAPLYLPMTKYDNEEKFEEEYKD